MKIPAVSKLLFSVKGIFLLAVGGKFVLVILNSLFGQIERKKRPLARAKIMKEEEDERDKKAFRAPPPPPCPCPSEPPLLSSSSSPNQRPSKQST